MALSLDDGGGAGSRPVDVQVNLVPFIDLMSCLVAFLLVTAAWTSVRQLPVRTGGDRTMDDARPPPPETVISVLLTVDGIWTGTPAGDRAQLAPGPDGRPDLAALERALAERRGATPTTALELAAEDGVTYQAIVSAMDIAVSSGFADLTLTEPASLSVRFRR